MPADAATFPIEGKRSRISESDLVAIRHAIEPDRIYRLRVISHNKVKVDLDARGYEGRLVERVESHWQVTTAIGNSFDPLPGLTTRSSEQAGR